MDKKLFENLLKLTPEEKVYLDRKGIVKKDIYTTDRDFEIDREMFLESGKMITVRSHSRFTDFPEHGHNFIEIMYVYSGSITHCIEGKDLVMEKGDILLMNPFVRHSVKRAEYEDIGINFIALPEFFDLPMQMLDQNNVLAEFLIGTLRRNTMIPQYLLFKLKDETEIDNLMENMIRSLFYKRSDEDIINQYSMGLVFLYLLQHVEYLSGNSSQGYKEVITQTVLNYLEHNYRSASLTKISEDCHRSVSSLSKIIRQCTGYTFQELLQRKRFQKAIILLVDSDLSVEEISLAVGYENQSYFHRQFLKRYNMTPKTYRIEHREDSRILL